jgi:heme/copper-type cytochrome/quinol oxidase subunit 2
MTSSNVRIAMTMLLIVGALIVTGPPARAQQTATISVTIKNHRFQPAELHAPANVPIELRVKNLDSTPMEFESVSLRVEKVVTPNSEGIIRLRPLAPGSYNFFDDFNQEANGVLVVK